MMNRGYQTQIGGFSSSNYNAQRYASSSSGFAQRTPLYPIGPTLAQPQFRPMTRGVSPSPYLNRQSMKPPSYQDWHLRKAQKIQINSQINYEDREKKLIQRNQRQIQQEQRRREQIRASYERQINALSVKLNKNVESKEKLLTQIQTLQATHQQLHMKLMSLTAPNKAINTFEPIDRKQQEMIIMKNKLVTTMRENETELNKLQEEEQKLWEERIADKEKILFRLQQNLREKRLELHAEKQKSLEKPDFLMIQEEIRMAQYDDFIFQYEELEQKIKRIIDQRERSAKDVSDTISLKKSTLGTQDQKHFQLNREATNIRLRVQQLQRVSQQMQAANQNLQKQLQRKQSMIDRYQLDIHSLNQKKTGIEAQINAVINDSRNQSNQSNILTQLPNQIQKLNQQIKFQQNKNNSLKNQYQRLYDLLCSATSKNIHQTFNETLAS